VFQNSFYYLNKYTEEWIEQLFELCLKKILLYIKFLSKRTENLGEDELKIALGSTNDYGGWCKSSL